ncbi:Hsp20/alpha crystallin family protein [Paucibacter sp. APW11]|uniref:Hsp20/alpha crystallin family protein n=1 Tax=Roseateles aquae TaxID=3077235 RepID=A0ABU3P7W0_9BURK|nr:Hsp20/alpha crystallin family protein [Paucibacter sp. APW11]MDT8997826.1 Hsp20/alpha crystallin family protein [Paucibacter sp. APW11]
MFFVPVARHANEFSRSLERLFDDGLAGLNAEPREAAIALRSPALDVSETDQLYTVRLEMPGVPKDAVKITIDGRRVNVEAEQRRDEEKKDGERVLYRERSVSRFSRSFALPEEINQSDSSAKMDHGVLTLTLAKRLAKGATQLAVN